MSYQKLKNNNYKNFGGINSKASPYATGQEEFLNLSNFDFQVPGSLTKRQGSTQLMSAGVSGRITGIYEVEFLKGASYITFSANTRLYYVNALTNTTIQGGLQDSSLMAFTTFVDRLFFCNGANFMKWQSGVTATGAGATAFLFSLPALAAGNTAYFGVPSSLPWANATLSWTFGWINDRGYFGPPSFDPDINAIPLVSKTVNNPFRINVLARPTAVTLMFGITQFYINAPASFGVGYGITVPIWFDPIGPGGPGTTTPDGYTFVTAAIAAYRDSGPGTSRFRINSYGTVQSDGGITFISALIPDTSRDIANIEPEPTSIYFTLAPRWLEIYNNQLFMSGFSSIPSSVYFSDIGEPESVQPDYNFEVRTNDGDRISGIKQYQSQLVIFKEKSFHALTGDSPDNFSIRQISDQYGCLSGRAIVQYENNLLFLDKKGVAHYNGSNVEIISSKIEPTFKSMNIDAAKDNAIAIHNRLNNQVWFGIPINGSTLNNATIVFDYLVNAWTVFEGFNPSSLGVIKGALTQPTAVTGSYVTGNLFYFGPSFFGDNGQGISLQAKSRFVQDLGESTEAQFRRLYLNFNTLSGASSIINIRFFQDYGASTVYSSTMPLNSFQSRIDFGIPARAVSFQIDNFSAVDAVVLHGFVMAHRFQRDV